MLARFRSSERDQETDAQRRKRIREALLNVVQALQQEPADGLKRNDGELALYLRLIGKLDKP